MTLVVQDSGWKLKTKFMLELCIETDVNRFWSWPEYVFLYVLARDIWKSFACVTSTVTIVSQPTVFNQILTCWWPVATAITSLPQCLWLCVCVIDSTWKYRLSLKVFINAHNTSFCLFLEIFHHVMPLQHEKHAFHYVSCSQCQLQPINMCAKMKKRNFPQLQHIQYVLGLRGWPPLALLSTWVYTCVWFTHTHRDTHNDSLMTWACFYREQKKFCR